MSVFVDGHYIGCDVMSIMMSVVIVEFVHGRGDVGITFTLFVALISVPPWTRAFMASFFPNQADHNSAFIPNWPGKNIGI